MRGVMLLLVCVFLALPGFGQTTLNGAGATFPYPIHSQWFSEYHQLHPDAQIDYQSIGGCSIRRLTHETVDPGASNMPMIDEQLKEAESRRQTELRALDYAPLPANVAAKVNAALKQVM